MGKSERNKITEVTRRYIIDALLLDREPFFGRLDLVSFLRRIWPLKEMPSTDKRFEDAEGDIWQHMVRNEDWTTDDLFYNHLDVLDMPDERFATLLQECVHPLVSTGTDRTARLVSLFNGYLSQDGFALRANGQISGHKLYKVVSTTGAETLPEAYEVVLSFAGEDREYVEEVADFLKATNVSLFYDMYEEATLWGKDLYEHLHKVYSSSARYCVMFISEHYANKIWPSHERRSAFERAIEAKDEYILPARFDDTPLPGLRKTVHYTDLRKKTPEQLAALILKKLGRHV